MNKPDSKERSMILHELVEDFANRASLSHAGRMQLNRIMKMAQLHAELIQYEEIMKHIKGGDGIVSNQQKGCA